LVPVTILMVDDNPEHIALCKEYLSDRFDISTAMSVGEAIHKLDDEIYDLVILDYDLPDGTGMDLLRKIKEMGVESKVIFVSGHDDLDLSFQALKLGANDFVVKTFKYYIQLEERILETLYD